MKLFDKMIRNDTGLALYTEPTFNYLNCSARSECKRIRKLLEQWFKHFPSEFQAELRGRFRSKDKRSHLAAFFELYLHELLLKSGFSIEIHPSIDGETKHPDYRVLKNRKPLFYLEATLASLSDVETSAEARENQFYDVLNKMNSPNFFIGVKVRGAPNTPLPSAKIRKFLERQLSMLNPDKISKQYELGDFEAIPHWDWEHEGCGVTFYPVPKKPQFRGKSGVHPIGFQMQDMRLLTPNVWIRESLRDKASKYGRLDLQYIVAINVINEFGANEIDIINALLGKEHFTGIFHGNELIEQRPWRKPNGAWYGPKGPQNKRVSAALIAVNLYPWGIAKVTPILWHNPWANYQLATDILPFPSRVFDLNNNQLIKHKGKNIWQLLRLYPNWPGKR